VKTVVIVKTIHTTMAATDSIDCMVELDEAALGFDEEHGAAEETPAQQAGGEPVSAPACWRQGRADPAQVAAGHRPTGGAGKRTLDGSIT
jgi:hypothetical protein